MAALKIIGKVGVKVRPDTSDFKREAKRDLDRIERELGDLTVDLIPNLDRSARERVKTEFNRLARELDGTNLEFDLGLKDGDVARIEAELDAIARKRSAEIDVDVDNSSLRQAFDSLLMLGGARPQIDAVRQSLETLGNLDYVAISVSKIVAQTTLLAGAALAATGHVLSVAGSLGQITPAALALPGIFGGIALGVTAFAVSMKDFNKYVPAFAVGLGKSAKAGQAWVQLQNQMSAAFWKNAAQPISNLLSTLFPQFAAGMRQVSTELGKFTANLANAFTGVFNGALAGMFDNLGKSIKVMSGYTGNLADIIKILGESGSSYLPALARWFGDLLRSFDGFLSAAQKDGSLKGWIDNGITQLGNLGNVVKQVGKIFYGLYTAARDAGGATLGSLASGLENIANVVNSGPFQKGLTQVFRTAFDMMSQITSQAGPGFEKFILGLANTFNTFGPSVAAGFGKILGELGKALSSPSVGKGINAVFVGISNAMDALAPTIKPVVDMLASLGPVIGALVTNIAVIGANGMNRFSDTIQGLAKALVPIINKLGSFFNDIGNSLIPVFKVMAENTTKVVTAFGPLIDAAHRLYNVLAPVLVPVLKFIVEMLGSALVNAIHGVTMVIDGIITVIHGVVEVFKGFGEIVSGIFSGDLSKIGDGIGKVFGGLKDIIGGALEAAAGAIWAWINGSVLAPFRGLALKLLKPFTKFLKPLKGVFEGAKNAVAPFFNWIVKGAEDGVTSVSGVFGRIKDVILYPFQLAFDALRPLLSGLGTVFKGVGTVVKAAFDVVVVVVRTAFQVVKTIIEAAWGVISTVFGTALSVIKTVVTSAFGGIVAFFKNSMDALYFVFKGPWDAVSAFLETTWATIKASAMLIWNAIRDFFNVMLAGWLNRFEDAWNAIKGVTTSVWNAIKGYFSTVWNGIKSVFTAAIDVVKTYLTNAWSNLRNNTSTVWNAIKGFIKGAWDAISGIVSRAVNAVKGFVSGVWNFVKDSTSNTWNTVSSKISGAWNSIKSIVSGAASRVQSLMSSAWDAIKSTVSSAWSKINSTVREGVGDAVSKIGSLPGRAVSVLGSLGGLLINAGSTLIGGFISGITSKIGAVKDTLVGLTHKLTSWKGPAATDRVLLTPAGQMIIDGLISGLESRYSDVRSSLQGLTNDIAKDFDSGQTLKVGVAASLATSAGTATSIDGVARKVTNTAAPSASASNDGASIHIDNVTIPLEDLKQLSTLEEFLDLLRVRTRQGVLS